MPERARANLTGVVLAGGQSRRMGQDKSLLELDGQTLIARVLQRLSPLCDELIISTNEVELYSDLPARIVPDDIPNCGALGGIHAGLSAMRNQKAVVVACDMPFLSLPLLRYMVVVAPGYDVVVLRLGEYYEPLHAVYDANCIAHIEKLLGEGRRRVVALFQRVRVHEVTEDQVRLFDADLSFFNVNTPQDWREAQRLNARKRRKGKPRRK